MGRERTPRGDGDRGQGRCALKPVAQYLSLVAFSHSIFALPFALQGAWLAAGGVPAVADLSWIVLAAVSARTAAMAFNRLVDRHMDARNPRTQDRELPAGRLSVGAVRALVVAASALFMVSAWALNPLAGQLSPVVLAVLLGYSYFKRFSALAHFVLGLALALAPLGAWIAIRGTLEGDLAPILWLAAAVWTWVAGFDVIYSCQDVTFDQDHGLHSVPARWGVARALWISRALHGITVVCLMRFCISAELGPIYWAFVALAAGLLAYEQWIVRADDLSRVDRAFFTLNGWVGVALFIGLVLDMGLDWGMGELA
ncbi:MAG: 4-hydroxybenzoate octaprenyltransferase [Planctomycetes bacterium]|nr:4-hydroxybenzoate octaprenyltransferase [Planctomycetota bacterium]